MNIQARKLALIQKLVQLQSEEVLTQLERLLKKSRKHEAESDLKPFSIQQLNERVSQSESDFKNGRYITTSELLAKY